jgi:hypothetical protein
MIEDLFRYHRPITTLFNQPRTAEEWEAHRLTDEQIEFFHASGYLAGVR